MIENKAKVGGVVQTPPVSRYTYAYDAIARRTSRAQEGSAFAQTNTDSFAYNRRNEVTASTNNTLSDRAFGYDYDAIGNRITATENAVTTDYSSNSLNQYTSVQSGSSADNPLYDADGNLTAKAGVNYTWNGENRLISVEPAVPNVGDKRLVFGYDYMGRRYQKTVYTWNASTTSWELAETRKFVYDGWNLILERTEGNTGALTSLKTYGWGQDLSGTLQGAGGVGGLLSSEEHYPNAHQGAYYYAYDANGNVSEVLNNSGTVAAHYEYSPFGKLVSQSGSYADENVFKFSTKFQDAETELLYYGFRYYNANLGRWVNREPLDEKGFELMKYYGNPDAIGEVLFESQLHRYLVKILNGINELNAMSVASLSDYFKALDIHNSIVEVANEVIELIDSQGSEYLSQSEVIESALVYSFLINAPLGSVDILGEKGTQERAASDKARRERNGLSPKSPSLSDSLAGIALGLGIISGFAAPLPPVSTCFGIAATLTGAASMAAKDMGY